MKASELQFLLKLLGVEEYRAPLSKIKLNPPISEEEREEICRKLCDRGFIICSYEISKFKIAPPGKFLLKQKLDNLPITDQELKVLRACTNDRITPAELDIPAEMQQSVLQGLLVRGLIEVKTKHKNINEVWLAERGKEYLQYEYNPSETTSIVSPELLNNFIQFLRKSFQEVSLPHSKAMQAISDDKILLTIVELERQLATDNHLPICYLRDKLHPLVSRDELDEALYRLQQVDKIELSSLQPANACGFTSEQIDEGIPQENGAPLFFVTLK